MTSKTGLAALAAMLAAAAMPTFAFAEDDIYETADPDMVVEVAKQFGSAELEKDDSGDPMVTGRLSGIRYIILFYDCVDATDCKSVQFQTRYTDTFTVEQANEWNKKFRWVKAVAGDGLTFTMDLSFIGGITQHYFEERFGLWNSLIADIKDFVGDK